MNEEKPAGENRLTLWFCQNKERYLAEHFGEPIVLYGKEGEIKELFGKKGEDEMEFLTRMEEANPVLDAAEECFLEIISEQVRNYYRKKKITAIDKTLGITCFPSTIRVP